MAQPSPDHIEHTYNGIGHLVRAAQGLHPRWHLCILADQSRAGKSEEGSESAEPADRERDVRSEEQLADTGCHD